MRAGLASGLIALVLALAANARADAVADFYRGRSITLTVGYSAGGGYDAYGRVLARHLSKHIPGRPSVIVQNMPGAGSLRAANFLYNVAPKDGTAIGHFSRGMAMEPLIGTSATQFDARRFAWLGSGTDEVSICTTWHTSAVKTWNDMLTIPFTVGGEGSGSDPDIFSAVMRNAFGVKLKLVSGYPGSAEVALAIERGEVDGRCGWSWDSIKSTRPDWLRERKINLLAVFSPEKAADIPAEVPLVGDLATSDEQRQVLRVHLAGQPLGRPFFTSPGVPHDRKAALRAAFDATLKDPDFIAETGKAKLEINPTSGAEIDRLLADIYATPRDVIEKAKQALRN